MADLSPNAKWQKWHDELEAARKSKGFDSWQTRASKIITRYRDERNAIDGTSDGAAPAQPYGSRFNILWSNVQTLMPALFAKTPKPVVERRYLDRDDVGRTASVILERALLYELDNGTYQGSLRKAVLDRLLPGRGVVWVRYEPKFMPMKEGTPGTAEPDAPEAASGDQQLSNPQDDTQRGEEVASECTPVDYVDWKDFMTSPARTWEEVWWIDRLVYMTRKQLVARFGPKGEEVTLDWVPNKDARNPTVTNPPTGDDDEGDRRAKVHETWDMSERKVTWWADGWSDDVLDEKDDPLKLEGFWPVPRPLYATLTNDTLVPVPDYTEYQDQALELDDLTNRITNLVATIKVAGLYDASVPELQRIFQEGKENELVGIENMAEFAQKAGPQGMGAIWLAPIAEQMKALSELYIARDQVKQSLYEITGISDIVRGAAATGGAKTATEQRIKGQFASMRLNDMQAEVARFARDTLRIMGEIIAEHYDPMTLFLISGYEQYAKEQWPPTPAPQQGMQPPPPMMGHNGGPPMGAPGPQGMPPQMGMMAPPPPPDPAMVAQQKAADMFKQAVALLRNDKLRGFRIDIETDSLIEADQQQTQQARTELMGALSQFLPQAIAAGQQMPQMIPLMARLVMFGVRGFKASRDIESALEQFTDDMTKLAANPQPKPPSPEEIKAKAEEAKAQLAMQQAQQQAQSDQAAREQEMALKEREFAMRQQEMQMQEQIAQAEHLRKMQEMDAKAALEARTAQIQADATEHAAIIDRSSREHQAVLGEQAATLKHDLGIEAMEAKAEATKKNGAKA